LGEKKRQVTREDRWGKITREIRKQDGSRHNDRKAHMAQGKTHDKHKPCAHTKHDKNT